MSRKDFGLYPQVKFNRSKFNMPHGIKTTMNVGTLYPISLVEVLPGDSFKTNMKMVSRVTSSFIKPVMDNMYMDVYHFFVPLRLCFDKLENVFGNPNPSAYVDNDLETIPTIYSGEVVSGSVADYLGLPVGRVPRGVSVLPFRAFAKIYNDWFRNENVTDEVYINKGSIASSERFNGNDWSPNNYLGMCPKVGKKKDYFTSALPNPQKGGAVVVSPNTITANGPFALASTNNSPDTPSQPINFSLPGNLNVGQKVDAQFYNNSPYDFIGVQDNLRYDSGLAVGSTSVNELRFAFQLQKALERDALYGSRYNEYLLGHYGVSSPDARLQFSEFLGGGRIPLNVQQVAQTSASTENSPLGDVGAYSLSSGSSSFNKGFVEHGYVITVACIRTMHTYQQGISKLFSRTERNHFYDPLFANLGEQPIYKSELYVDDDTSSLRDTNQIFGYNEAWADYRYLPNSVTGGMRTASGTDLDIWHFADVYSNAPSLNNDFILENTNNIDRTLSVPSSSIPNFICDFWFDTSAIRVMPVYSVPGLVDHH